MEEFTPWIDYPGLTADRLTFVAGRICHARAGCVALHDPESGDNTWSLGCRAYARCCHELRLAAHQHDWLQILPDVMPLRVTFAIGGWPIRFYRGDVTMVPLNYLSRTTAEAQQLNFFGAPDDSIMLRLAVLTQTTGEVSSTSLVEFDSLTKLPLRSFEIVLPTDAGVTPIATPAPPVVLPPVTVSPLPTETSTDESTGTDDE